MRAPDAALFLFAVVEPVLSIPRIIPPPSIQPLIPSNHSLQQRQKTHTTPPQRQVDPLSSLLIPQCALACYLDALPNDGCTLEIDLKCHCSTGNILGLAEPCVEAGCSKTDQEDAKQKVVRACQAVGISLSVPIGPTPTTASAGPSSSRGASTEVATTHPASSRQSMTSAYREQPTAAVPPASNGQPSYGPSSSSTNQTAAASASSTIQSPLYTSTSTSTPTQTPVTAPATNDSLSEGAKAGISVSVLFVASSIFIALSLYIRRLKRQLALAKAAANVPDSVLRSPSYRHSHIPEPFFTPSRRQSWPIAPHGRRRSRGEGMMPSESPVSPLSPVFSRDGSRRSSITGMLHRKRATVLSVVVEQDDEDSNSLMSRRRSVREPVPGQSEGLVGPLEMDGQFAAIFEAPTSITPRPRSKEGEGQDWKEYDFGKL